MITQKVKVPPGLEGDDTWVRGVPLGLRGLRPEYANSLSCARALGQVVKMVGGRTALADKMGFLAVKQDDALGIFWCKKLISSNKI